MVILGPSHHFSFPGISVSRFKGYETPLGISPIDEVFCKKLATSNPAQGWLPQVEEPEHSLEIQVPFLQIVSGKSQIVPIIMGDDAWETCTHLAQTLVEQIKGPEKTLLLASSDLSHFYPAKQARQLDQEFIKQVRELNPQALYADLRAKKTEACGRAPVLTVLLAAKALGANQAAVLQYAHSGDITGELESVVGYVAIALFKKDR